ncbi:MAG: response regulator transcription factor [Bacteroidota bacterium]
MGKGGNPTSRSPIGTVSLLASKYLTPLAELVRIFLADDHQLILDGMEQLLAGANDLEVVGTAGNGTEALRNIQLLKPDLAMLDLNMPGMHGMQVAETLIKEQPDLRIMILSLHAEPSVIRHMLKLGVKGYLIKTASQAEVLQAVRTVAKGQAYFTADVTQVLAMPDNQMQVKSGSPATALQTQLALLSEREVEVLKLIAEGFSNKEISEQLFVSPRTIDAHRANLMKKLDIRKVTGLVRFALKTGLVD